MDFLERLRRSADQAGAGR